MTPIREPYNPNAYLRKINNINTGLAARTRLLNNLEDQPVSAGALARKIGMTYSAARHHLQLLEAEDIICRKGRRPSVWMLTGLGQKRIVS